MNPRSCGAGESACYAFTSHVRPVVLTGCRAGEWARVHWTWVDLDQKLLTIPAEAYKTDHVLSSTRGDKPFWGVAKFEYVYLPRAIVALRGESFSTPFTFHDLRRTVATRNGEALSLGGEQLIRKVLGHSGGSVAVTYSCYGYVKGMRAALEAGAIESTK